MLLVAEAFQSQAICWQQPSQTSRPKRDTNDLPSWLHSLVFMLDMFATQRQHRQIGTSFGPQCMPEARQEGYEPGSRQPAQGGWGKHAPGMLPEWQGSVLPFVHLCCEELLRRMRLEG